MLSVDFVEVDCTCIIAPPDPSLAFAKLTLEVAEFLGVFFSASSLAGGA